MNIWIYIHIFLWKKFTNEKFSTVKNFTNVNSYMIGRSYVLEKNCLWKKSLIKTLSPWKISQTVTQILNFFEMEALTSLLFLNFCEGFHKVPRKFRLINKYPRGSTCKRFQSEDFHKCQRFHCDLFTMKTSHFFFVKIFTNVNTFNCEKIHLFS